MSVGHSSILSSRGCIKLLLCALLLIALLPAIAKASDMIPSACPSTPVCPAFSVLSLSTYSFRNIWGRLAHPMKCSQYEYDFGKEEHRKEAVERLSHLLSQVVGQTQAIREVKAKIIAHIAKPPNLPLVLLFSGDNGVGKTMTANLVSLALSLRCGDERCQHGDSALVITAPESNIEARDSIVKRVINHVRHHPHGMVIINEALLLHPRVVESLAPLFGRGASFHDFPEDSLSGLIIILTTDFGKSVGITQGKTSAEIGALTRKAMADRFGKVFATDVSAVSFLPVSYEYAVKACRIHIQNLPCRNPGVVSVTVDDETPEAIVDHLVAVGGLAEDNVREIAKLVETSIDGTVEEMRITDPDIPTGAKVSVQVRTVNKQLLVRVKSTLPEAQYSEQRFDL